MKKKVLIVFLDYHLPYSPTTLGLYDELSSVFEVEILTIERGNPVKVIDRKVTYLKPIPNFITLLKWKINNQFYKLNKGKPNRGKNAVLMPYEKYIEYDKLIYFLNNNRFDHIIAADIFAALAVQKCTKNYTFLSLELLSNFHLLNQLQMEKIDSVITQIPDRYNHLFGSKSIQTFYIQNAPVFEEIIKPVTDSKKLVFSGHASKGFGAYCALNFIKKYPEYQLTLQGNQEGGFKENCWMFFGDLVDAGQVVFHEKYMAKAELNTFLSQYRIGFCFYDFRYEYINNINYRTAPSGKLFQYYLSGVPVIAINIPGLASVKEFEAGVLIDDYNPDTIKKAIDTIEKDYEKYVENCFKAARYFDFSKNVKPLLKFFEDK